MNEVERSGKALPLSDNLAIIAHRMLLKAILSKMTTLSSTNVGDFKPNDLRRIRDEIRRNIANSALSLKDFGRPLSRHEQAVVLREVDAIIIPLTGRLDDD